jgi:hypothetical protein
MRLMDKALQARYTSAVSAYKPFSVLILLLQRNKPEEECEQNFWCSTGEGENKIMAWHMPQNSYYSFAKVLGIVSLLLSLLR